MAPLCLCFDHVSQISQLKATLFICKHTHVDLRDQHQNGPGGGGLYYYWGLTFVGYYNIFYRYALGGVAHRLGVAVRLL